jgi:paired amphipathic helix protein Sin3a
MFNSNNAVEELDDAVTHLNLGEQDTESINTAVREDLSENVPERQHAYSQDFNQQELPTMQPQQEHVLQPQQTLPTMQGGPLPGQNPPRQRVADAFNYLNVVKQTFVNQPQVYSQFLEIMKQFKLQQ